MSKPIRLHYNENPYGASTRATIAAHQSIKKSAYYTDQATNDLMQFVADSNSYSLNNILLTSGATEFLNSAILAYGKKGTLVTPWPTYTDHIIFAEALGINICKVPLAENMNIDLDAMLNAIDSSTSLVFICNPNNPTGLALDTYNLKEFIRAVPNDIPVLIDEAYIEFTDDPENTSMLHMPHEGQNVLIARTFSKIYGMAGQRIGYGLGLPDSINSIWKYTTGMLNTAGIAMAYHALQDIDYIEKCRNNIILSRNNTIDTFTSMGCKPLNSQTNFVYCDIGVDALDFKNKLQERNILVHGADQYIRVTMGTKSDMDIFNEVFCDLYKKDK
jgi:histidinol-phosphate aminotransferase